MDGNHSVPDDATSAANQARVDRAITPEAEPPRDALAELRERAGHRPDPLAALLTEETAD